MPTKFNEINAQTARQLLGISLMGTIGARVASDSVAAAVETNKKFVWENDYFQEGEQGAFPGLLSDTTGETLEAVRSEFATLPALEGINRRKRRGVVGREPSWSYEPRVLPDEQGDDDETQKSPEEKLADVSGSAMTSFWERSDCGLLAGGTRIGMHGLVQAAVDSLNVTGEIAVRIFPRQDAAENGQIKKQAKIEDALSLMYVELLTDGFVHSYLDRATMREMIGYEYKEVGTGPDGLTPVEKNRLVITYLDDTNLTMVRSWTDGIEDPRADPLDLNGQLMIWRIKTTPFISRPLRELQNQLSKSITMMGHNNNLAGFLELIATGLLPPGDWSKQSVDGHDTYVYVQDEEAEIGPGKMAFLNQAMVYDQAAGGWKFPTSSGITKIDPIDPAYLIKAAEYLYLCMLRTADQDHTLMSGDATASAVSRVESRAQFVWSLLEVKVVVESMLRWLLETVLLMAVNLTLERTATKVGGVETRALSAGSGAVLESYKALRARVDVHASAGPLAPDEKRVVIEEYQAGLMAEETAIVMLGTEDVDAEIAALESDPLRIAAVIEAQGKAMAALKEIMPVELALDVVTGEKTLAEAVAAIPAGWVKAEPVQSPGEGVPTETS